MHTRRSFIAGAGALATMPGCATEDDWSFPIPPARRLTSGPRHHWFGYYDKLEFDPTNRYVLGMQVDFEGRKPVGSDVIGIGMVDLEEGDRWIDLGASSAWSWQQGCMLQWIPSTPSQVIWNDRENGSYVSRILDIADASGSIRTLPRAIFCLTPDGKTAFTIDFARIQTVRPGYGYAGILDPYRDELAPAGSGIWRMDMETGSSELIYSIAQAAVLEPPDGGFKPEARHWVYHLLVSTDASRLAFLHCNAGDDGIIFCRMITMDLDGRNAHVLDPHGKTSHYDWRDGSTVLAWALQPETGYGFYLFDDKTREVEQIGDGIMTVNGHCTYLTDRRWILNDTYPDGAGNQNPFLFDTETERLYSLGAFNSPLDYRGEFRCDTHPRSSRDGRSVVIDSPHEDGRQMYLIDVSSILDSVEP